MEGGQLGRRYSTIRKFFQLCEDSSHQITSHYNSELIVVEIRISFYN